MLIKNYKKKHTLLDWSFNIHCSESSAGHRTNRCSVSKYDDQKFGNPLKGHQKVTRSLIKSQVSRGKRALFFSGKEISLITGHVNSISASDV